MSGAFCAFIARRALFKRRGNALTGAALAIGLSLAPLILAMEVSQAMTGGILARYIETSSYHFQAVPLYLPQEPQSRLAAIFNKKAALSQRPEVSAAFVEQQSYAVAFSALGREGVLVRGVEPDFYNQDSQMARYLRIEQGSANLSQDNQALIGASIAKNLGLQTGDRLRLLSARKEENAFVPSIASFTVAGIVSTGYQELDKTWIFIPLNASWQLFSPEAAKAFINIKTPDPYQSLPAKTEDLNAAAGAGWIVYNWHLLNRAQIDNFETTKALLLFVLGLAVCVAAVNTAGSLHMFFLENKHEIAVLKAMGASPKQIETIFLGCGLLAGALGALGGLGAGLLLALNVNGLLRFIEKTGSFFAGFSSGGQALDLSFYLNDIPIRLNGPRLLVCAAAVVILAAAASWRPARRAARRKPLADLKKF